LKLTLNPEYQLYERGGTIFCDSLQIAETFEKRHADVLRDVDKNIAVLEKIGERKFAFTSFIQDTYRDTQNKKQPRYLMTRDGFTKLAFGYEGEKAAKFQVDYINRFNQMEAFIQSLLATKMEFPAFTEAIMLSHEEPKHYHFSNEINMIYRIVLGMDAKQFRVANGLAEGEVIKPHLSLDQIKAVELLQRIDIGLIEVGWSYDQRKEQLTDSHSRRARLRVAG
jgi:Rha family phage regulatory protein